MLLVLIHFVFHIGPKHKRTIIYIFFSYPFLLHLIIDIFYDSFFIRMEMLHLLLLAILPLSGLAFDLLQDDVNRSSGSGKILHALFRILVN